MSSIGGGKSLAKAVVGVATEDGRSYFQIASLLNLIRVPYIDVILTQPPPSGASRGLTPDQAAKDLQLVITTRRERLRVPTGKVLCIEDLGNDPAVAKERVLSLLYPTSESDWFVVGIDPGERTGIAAFMNQVEVESSVSVSVEETLKRVSKLIDNAPRIRKAVKIGMGTPTLAREIARRLGAQYRNELKIQLVDERGTSSLGKGTKNGIETRDQRAAKLIAFRDGQDFQFSS